MIKLAKIFQDGMTFQRNKPCKVWGTSSEVKTVTIYMNEKEVAERELPQGDFAFFLPPQEAAQNVTVRIGNDVVLRNVDFGEVWFAGGQSNMEFPMKYDSQFEEMKSSRPDEHLRYYEVAKYSFEGEEEEGLKTPEAVVSFIQTMHREYVSRKRNVEEDCRYIVRVCLLVVQAILRLIGVGAEIQPQFCMA